MHDAEATRLGQIAYAAYHGRPMPIDADEWPPGDKIVQRWEAVGRALLGAIKAQAEMEATEAGEQFGRLADAVAKKFGYERLWEAPQHPGFFVLERASARPGFRDATPLDTAAQPKAPEERDAVVPSASERPTRPFLHIVNGSEIWLSILDENNTFKPLSGPVPIPRELRDAIAAHTTKGLA